MLKVFDVNNLVIEVGLNSIRITIEENFNYALINDDNAQDVARILSRQYYHQIIGDVCQGIADHNFILQLTRTDYFGDEHVTTIYISNQDQNAELTFELLCQPKQGEDYTTKRHIILTPAQFEKFFDTLKQLVS